MKLCYEFPEVSVIGLLYIRLTGIAQLDLMVGHALGGEREIALVSLSLSLSPSSQPGL